MNGRRLIKEAHLLYVDQSKLIKSWLIDKLE